MVFDVPNLTAESALELSAQLHSCVPSEKMILDFSNMSNFDPFAMLLAGSIIRRYRNEYPDVPFFLHGHENKSYAGRMGFFKYISPNISYGKMPGDVLGNNSYIPITPINLDELYKAETERGNYLPIGEVIEKEAGRLSYVIDREENNELHHLLTYLIREIIRNTVEHAECSTVWICGQFWPRFRLAEIAILDEGIGIYKSITQNLLYKEHINDNKTALEWVVKAGISEAFNPLQKQKSCDGWTNSGFGLFMVSNICKMLDGCFNLASGNNFIKMTKDGYYSGKTSLYGTAVRLSIPTDKIYNAQMTISQIAKQGVEEAKTLKNAFKKASKPSEGLIIKNSI